MSFRIDTNLLSTSPLTVAFIDEYLSRKPSGNLAGVGAAAKVAEEIHGVNATYIVAHAALETAWGTSRIAREKNNLFGWRAFDSSPYVSAKEFPTRAECILFVVERIKTLYLVPHGKYYVKAPCLGFRGPDGYGMNVHYATDAGWGAKIANIARAMEASFESRED